MEKYEAQVHEFLKNIMENQGFFVRCPVGMANNRFPPKETNNIAKEVWKQTCEMLDMMSITYQTNTQNLSIMVVDI